MFQLSISAACTYVRRVLDELTSVEEIGMLVCPDAVDLHKLVEGSIVEAAVKVQNQAPSIMIDGIKGEFGTNKDYVTSIKDGVITILMLKDTLRLASIKAVDSEVVVCDVIPEDSAEGRKQLNKYVRGVPDDPRVVLQKNWSTEYRPVFKYYTIQNVPMAASDMDENPDIDIEGNVPGVDIEGTIPPTDNDVPSIDIEGTIPPTDNDVPSIDIDGSNPVELYYVPYPMINESVVEISPKLEYAVLNELTAMVLDSLNEHDKAALYRDKSLKYMEGK